MSIPPGALVGLARVDRNILRWGETYALATKDGVMIKRLLPIPDDSDRVICASYNQTLFPDFVLPRADIYDVARITCVIPIYRR